MALWLVRVGKHGEHEPAFFANDRIYLTWRELQGEDLGALDEDGLLELLQRTYPRSSTRKLGSWAGQIHAFSHKMAVGDWVAVPRKSAPQVAIGEILGEFEFDPKAEMMQRHSRRVRWIDREVPRGRFDLDILPSLNALMTVCRIRRNDAERRVRAMFAAKGKGALLPPVDSVRGDQSRPSAVPATSRELDEVDVEDLEDDDDGLDLEQSARDRIAAAVIRKFHGHGMARLVDAILKAQGFFTYRSPEGPDKGVDLLAAPGPLGFGRPRICVQVKAMAVPVDHPTLSQLVGTMQHVGADQGLLVSWGGFKRSVDRARAEQFFKVRLWDQDDLLAALLDGYDRLDADVRAELPLKRIWSLASEDAHEDEDERGDEDE